MASDRNSRRRTRSGGTKRRNEPSDALVVALTAQVIICLLLLISAGIGKKLNESRYDTLQQQYTIMVTDKNEAERVLAYFREQDVGEWLSDAKEAVASMFSRKKPTKDSAKVYENEETKEPAVSPSEELDIDEPVSGNPPLVNRNYDYLNPQESALSAAGGQGGFFPIDLSGKNKEELSAPKGSVLSPVYLCGKIIPPITGPITSNFSYRYHPITETTDFHTGMDIAAEEGRAILAVLPGEVVEVGQSAIYGNYIVLQHAENFQTSYSHCSEILAKEGMHIRQGERIAKVGQTGTATGPHLHFSVLVEGLYTDPYWVLKDHIEDVG